MDCSGAKRAPMVETKRNKAAIRLALSSAYSFGVAADEIAHQNPEIESGHVREEALEYIFVSSQMRSSHASRF